MRVIVLLLVTLALTSVCADQTFSIVGFSGTQGLDFNISGTIVTKPSLNVTYGETITFRIEKYMEDGDKNILPFGLCGGLGCTPDDFTGASEGRLNASASCVTNSSYIPNAYYVNPTTGIPCILTWTVVEPKEGYPFFYTSRNQVYKGEINVLGVPTASGSTTPPPSGTTTSPPTGTTTSAPTTPAPGTGKNSAALIVPGAVATFICTAINALFA